MFPTKERDKTPETDLKEMEIHDLSDKKFKITVMKIPLRSGE